MGPYNMNYSVTGNRREKRTTNDEWNKFAMRTKVSQYFDEETAVSISTNN